MREERHPTWHEQPPWGCSVGLAGPQEWATRPRSVLCLVGVAGGHSGREKQEGRVQGWLQAGVQQAAAGAREQVGRCLPGCPLLDIGVGHQPGWEGLGCWSPSLTLAMSQP